MNAWIRRSKTGTSLFAAAMLLALGLRLLIPAGFMPMVGSQGLVVELCSGISGKSVTIDIGKNRPPENPSPKADGPCVFATGLGHNLLPSTELSTLLPFVYGLTIFVGTAIADQIPSRLPAPPPPSQGPPALR